MATAGAGGGVGRLWCWCRFALLCFALLCCCEKNITNMVNMCLVSSMCLFTPVFVCYRRIHTILKASMEMEITKIWHTGAFDPNKTETIEGPELYSYGFITAD